MLEQLEFRKISASSAVSFVKTWHYSQTCSPGVYRYGAFLDGELIAVSVYNNGVRRMQQGVFGPEYANHVLHHHRLAIDPSMQQEGVNVGSWMIGKCNRALQDEGIYAVVTYADLDQGHNGTVYRATNALFTGIETKGNIYYKDKDGAIVTTHSRPNTGPGGWKHMIEVWAPEQGLTMYRSKGKARYVYLLPQLVLPESGQTYSRDNPKPHMLSKKDLRKLLKWKVVPFVDPLF